MSRATTDLPDDPAELRRVAGDLQRDVVALAAEVHAKTLLIEKLKMQLAVLRRARFGRSSERLDREVEQLELLISDIEESEAEHLARSGTTETATLAAVKKRPSVRAPLPAHLPLETIVHDAPCVCPTCGGRKFGRIDTDEREVLEYVPSHFKRVLHVRPKMSCRICETIVQAPMPSLPIEKGRPGPALLAHVIVSKYCDHLPLHRQSDIYARNGVEIDRSVMAGWVGHMAALLEPLSERIARHVRAGGAIHADDTPVPVLDPGRGRTKTGRLWAAVRDERPYGSPAPPAAFYRYSPDRKAEHAHALLDGCRGFLHADGYAGFGGLYESDPETGAPAPLTEVACWAHARRKIYDVHAATNSPAAAQALDIIARLFAIEADVRGRSPAERVAARRQRAVPVLAELKIFLDATLAKISGKSDFAGAIRYATSRWTALTRYVDNGRLEMSNNAAERAIRPLALGRKNYLFAGSDTGGRRAAILYTLPRASTTPIHKLGSPTSSPASPIIQSRGSTNYSPGHGSLMRKEPRHLKQLEKELLALGEETMLLEELDGFIAGVLVCPEVIPPSEWLPVVWGQIDDQTAPVFDTVAHMNKMLTLVMEHYNDVAKKFFEMPERYAPLFAIDNRNGDVLWELWIEGFEKAVKLRPAAWRPLLDADVETAKAMSGLLTLADVARRDERFSELEYHALEATAHERISPFVLALNEWRVENHDPKLGKSAPPAAAHSSFRKVGRNDPCPCGSGKKYKKCCGLN